MPKSFPESDFELSKSKPNCGLKVSRSQTTIVPFSPVVIILSSFGNLLMFETLLLLWPPTRLVIMSPEERLDTFMRKGVFVGIFRTTESKKTKFFLFFYFTSLNSQPELDIPSF